MEVPMISRSDVKSTILSLSRLVRKDHVVYGDSILPPKHLRFCGGEFRDDAYFLTSAKNEAERLTKKGGLNKNSAVLDIGCGPGRLAIGILGYRSEIARYEGIDVDRASVEWATAHLMEHYPKFRFSHLDVHNARYNPAGHVVIDKSFQFPFGANEFDIAYLYSVFSHMTQQEVNMYLSELRRLLRPNGKLFLTGFFEKDVEAITVNPAGYRREWKGDLHCVRYNVDHFSDLLEKNGFIVTAIEYQTETDGQSGLYALRS
jgi:SAM-dependent methyltransferase